jgi:hypothetical protein
VCRDCGEEFVRNYEHTIIYMHRMKIGLVLNDVLADCNWCDHPDYNGDVGDAWMMHEAILHWSWHTAGDYNEALAVIQIEEEYDVDGHYTCDLEGARAWHQRLMSI